MPYKDPDKQRQVTRDWMAVRRAQWLEAHPCACGQPSVAVIASQGAIPKGVWSWKEERREAALAAVGAQAMCQAHRDMQMADRAEQMSVERTKPETVRRRKRKATTGLSVEAAPTFDRRAWREERRERLGYSQPKE